MKTVVMLAALTASVAQAQDRKPQAKDEEAILGTWQLVSAEAGGEKAPDKAVKSFRMTFKAGGKVTVRIEDEDRNGTWKLDPTRKPRQIDLDVNFPLTAASQCRNEARNAEGIYELDDDNLKICLGDRADARPTQFKSPEGSTAVLLVLKRVKK